MWHRKNTGEIQMLLWMFIQEQFIFAVKYESDSLKTVYTSAREKSLLILVKCVWETPFSPLLATFQWKLRFWVFGGCYFVGRENGEKKVVIYAGKRNRLGGLRYLR